MSISRIGILTSGGDCPGLNAVISGAVRAAAARNWGTIGFRDGFEGLLGGGDYIELLRSNTSGIMHLGGTILGTTNRGHFGARKRGAHRSQVDPAILADARECLLRLGVGALIAIGGDGSLSTALQLYRIGVPIVGVPKTIDNDLESTACTFGFDSAVACVAEALNRLHTTATSHRRAMVLEVMGRNTGWIALHGGLAGGADMILIPEIPFDFDRITQEILRRESAGSGSTLIVVAEGARPKDGGRLTRITPGGESRLGGVGEEVARQVGVRTRKEIRTCVLGHLQRGGPPTTTDRILGTLFGVHAVDLAAQGKFGSMVSYLNDHVTDVPIESAVHRQRKVDPSGQMVGAARAIGVSFGD